MKKVFSIEGRECEFCECTAIAASIGDTERQKAIFVHVIGDIFRDCDGVIFYDQLPQSDEDAKALLKEEPYDTYYDTLETVKIEDEKGIIRGLNEFIWD